MDRAAFFEFEAARRRVAQEKAAARAAETLARRNAGLQAFKHLLSMSSATTAPAGVSTHRPADTLAAATVRRAGYAAAEAAQAATYAAAAAYDAALASPSRSRAAPPAAALPEGFDDMSASNRVQARSPSPVRRAAHSEAAAGAFSPAFASPGPHALDTTAGSSHLLSALRRDAAAARARSEQSDVRASFSASQQLAAAASLSPRTDRMRLSQQHAATALQPQPSPTLPPSFPRAGDARDATTGFAAARGDSTRASWAAADTTSLDRSQDLRRQQHASAAASSHAGGTKPGLVVPAPSPHGGAAVSYGQSQRLKTPLSPPRVRSTHSEDAAAGADAASSAVADDEGAGLWEATERPAGAHSPGASGWSRGSSSDLRSSVDADAEAAALRARSAAWRARQEAGAAVQAAARSPSPSRRIASAGASAGAGAGNGLAAAAASDAVFEAKIAAFHATAAAVRAESAAVIAAASPTRSSAAYGAAAVPAPSPYFRPPPSSQPQPQGSRGRQPSLHRTLSPSHAQALPSPSRRHPSAGTPVSSAAVAAPSPTRPSRGQPPALPATLSDAFSAVSTPGAAAAAPAPFGSPAHRLQQTSALLSAVFDGAGGSEAGTVPGSPGGAGFRASSRASDGAQAPPHTPSRGSLAAAASPGRRQSPRMAAVAPATTGGGAAAASPGAAPPMGGAASPSRGSRAASAGPSGFGGNVPIRRTRVAGVGSGSSSVAGRSLDGSFTGGSGAGALEPAGGAGHAREVGLRPPVAPGDEGAGVDASVYGDGGSEAFGHCAAGYSSSSRLPEDAASGDRSVLNGASAHPSLSTPQRQGALAGLPAAHRQRNSSVDGGRAGEGVSLGGSLAGRDEASAGIGGSRLPRRSVVFTVDMGGVGRGGASVSSAGGGSSGAPTGRPSLGAAAASRRVSLGAAASGAAGVSRLGRPAASGIGASATSAAAPPASGRTSVTSGLTDVPRAASPVAGATTDAYASLDASTPGYAQPRQAGARIRSPSGSQLPRSPTHAVAGAADRRGRAPAPAGAAAAAPGSPQIGSASGSAFRPTSPGGRSGAHSPLLLAPQSPTRGTSRAAAYTVTPAAGGSGASVGSVPASGGGVSIASAYSAARSASGGGSSGVRAPRAASGTTASSRARAASNSRGAGASAGAASAAAGASAGAVDAGAYAHPGSAARRTGGHVHAGSGESIGSAFADSPAAAAAGAGGSVGGRGGGAASSTSNPPLPVAARATNRQRVANALQFVCLAGAHRAAELAAALQAMAAAAAGSFPGAEEGAFGAGSPGSVAAPRPAEYFLVLLASPDSLSYRGLYSFDPATCEALKLHGIGPSFLTDAVLALLPAGSGGALTSARGSSGASITGCFKYNSGQRRFEPIASLSVGLTTDAITVRAKRGK